MFISSKIKEYTIRFASFVFCIAGHIFYTFFKSGRKFKFQGKTYTYFYHPYNYTWRSERAIEIPIFREILKENQSGFILEVGNVLSHYFRVNHDVVDKYEKAKGVINKDISLFKTKKRYNLIISISTLEHVGWDEIPKKPQKTIKTLKNLSKLLLRNGKMVVSVPIGYNPWADTLFKKRSKFAFTKLFCLKRISKDNLWKQTSWGSIKNSKFSKPFRFANGLVIGIYEKGN